MLWLLPFGSALARRFGAVRFFLFMAVTAAAGALAHLVTHEHAVAPMIGASASVSGTMAAAIRFAFVRGSFLSFSRGDADAAAKVPALSLSRALRNARVLGFLAVWFGVNIIFGVGSIAIGADGASVAWQAHIGGFFAGLMLFSLFDPVPRALADAADASSPDRLEPHLIGACGAGRFHPSFDCEAMLSGKRASERASPSACNETGAELLIEDSMNKIAPAQSGAIGFREATMTVRAILDSKGHQIMSVEPDAKLSAAIKILAERKIGAVLVMSQGRIEGILSERDIVRVLGERGAGVLDEPVSAVMTRKVVSCRQTDTVAAIMEMMTLGKFRHLPVVEDGKVVGLISIGDVVKWRVQEYETEQEALRDYIKTA